MIALRRQFEDKIQAADLGFKEVKGAAGLAQVLSMRVSAPSCYVFNMQEL